MYAKSPKIKVEKQITLVITQRQNLRTWVYQGLLDSLADRFKVTLYIPEQLSDLGLNNAKVNVIHWRVNNNAYWERITHFLTLTRHRHYKSYAERIKRSLLDEKMFDNRVDFSFNLLKSFKRKPMLYLLHLKLIFRLVEFFHERHISRHLLKNVPKSSVHLVVVSLSDYVTSILLASLRSEGCHIVQIVDNWDNLSSKLCPVYSPDKIIVWSEQTKKHAVEIHEASASQVLILGSPRFPNRRIIDSLVRHHERDIKPGDKKVRIFYAGFFSECNNLDSILELFGEIESKLEMYQFQFIFRPHPMNLPHKRISEHHHLKISNLEIEEPFIDEKNTSGWPLFSESLYTGLLDSDVVIVSPSTFLLEALLFNKRIILDNRDCSLHYNSPRRHFLQNNHLDEIILSSTIPRINNTNEAPQILLESLANEMKASETLKDYLIYNDDQDYAKRLEDFVSLEIQEIQKPYP